MSKSECAIFLRAALLTHSDGTRVDYGAMGGPMAGAVRVYPIRITDRNGNFVDLGYPENTGPRIATILDTLGRTIRFHYDGLGDLVTITVPGYAVNSDRQTVRFYYQTLELSHNFQGVVVAPGTPTTARVVKYIYFPGTRSGFRYDYSAYGMIASTVQLRNMQVSHNELNQLGEVTSEGVHQVAATTAYNYPMNPSNLTDAPTYTQRTDTYAGQTSGDSVYHFGPVPSQPGVTTVMAPDGTAVLTPSLSTRRPAAY